MPMAIDLLILLVAVLFAWFGHRRTAILSFVISFGLAILIFFHHMTDTIGLSL